MTCAWRARFMMSGLPEEAIAELDRHAASCEECALRLDAQRRTFALLQEEPAPLELFEQARLWAKIDSARRETRAPWKWIAVAAGAAAAVVVALSLQSEELVLETGHGRALEGTLQVAAGDPPPRDTWLELAPGSVLELGDGRLVAAERTVLSIPEGPRAAEIWIARGIVKVELLEPGAPRVVVTQAGRIELFAGRSELRIAGERVELAVESGRADVAPKDGAKRTVVAGEADRMAPPVKAEPAPAPPEPKAAPPPPRAKAPARVEEVETLLSAADQDRRAGRLAEAAAKYARAAEHPRGGPFFEEAAVREAAILAELGRSDAALTLLARMEHRIGRGKLGPERAALEARLWLGKDAAQSAAILERWSGAADRVLDLARLEVAAALRSSDRTRAEALLRPVRRPGNDLALEAERLLSADR